MVDLASTIIRASARAASDELGKERRHLTEDSLEDELLVVVCEGDSQGAGDSGSVEALTHLCAATHHQLGNGLMEPVCLSHFLVPQ
jgi:hypothetical protein